MTLTQDTTSWQEDVDNFTQVWDGKLVLRRHVYSDPLTGRAYFDAIPFPVHQKAESRHLARSSRHRKDRYMQVNIHCDMLDFQSVHGIGSTSPTNGGGGKRGEIKGFSRASRKRMIEFMAKTRFVGQLLFATFTYPDAFPIDDKKTWDAHFEALRRRIEREYPEYNILWRKELKRRKSGRNIGYVAPHWHMIIDTKIESVPDIREDHYLSYGISKPKTTSSASRKFERWALQAWSEIVGSGDVKHGQQGCFVVACRNRRHAFKYISKYVAKEENDDFVVGRRWGRIGKWNTASSGYFVLTRIELIELKRLLRGWMKSKGIDYRKFIASMPLKNGFSILGLGDAARTGNLFRQLINHAASLAGELPPMLSMGEH